jgi:cyclopropane fatty-acyl-phospholipid synthase-like methyltransferase
MTQDWQQIWNRRGHAEEMPRDLQRLLEIDGYDSGAGRLTATDFREYVRAIAERLTITDGSSVYEVGCGVGAFLFALRERYDLRLGGCDYAPALIAMARRLFPAGEFAAAEAPDVSTVPNYDIVLARGVFHYFPNFDYARRVLECMIAKAGSAVAILEVPNEGTRVEAERVRRDQLTQAIYEEKYRGLEHLYYAPQWFGEIAEKCGCYCEHSDHPVPNYAQSRFRFDVVIRKRQ